jgi:hypothetical protein
MNKEIEKIFVDLIQTSLDLPNDYGEDPNGNTIPCVTIKSQNLKLFNTTKLQITVSTLQNQIFSNRKEYRDEVVDDVTKYYEDIYINENRTMQIDIYSRNNDARTRFPEVQACLNSTYAEQLQDKYQFRIGVISNAVNLSGLDGGSDINRFTIRFQCLTWNKYTKEVDYYNSFRTQVRNTNENIFADFTIENNEIINN